MFLLLLALQGSVAVDVTRCDGASDAQALRRHAENINHLPVPKTHFHWSQLDTLDIGVVLPYVASTFRYSLTFEPLRRHTDSHSNRCSSSWDPLLRDGLADQTDFDTSEDQSSSDKPVNRWSFAPNANFPRAFTDRTNYAANFVSNSSIWRASAIDCAHVRYTTSINLDQLVECSNTLASIKLDSGAHALLGTLFVSGFAEYNDAPVYDHRYHIAIYSDAHGNAAMLVDSGHEDFAIVLRSVEATAEYLNMRIQTTNDVPLRLDSVTPRMSDGLELLPMHVELVDSYQAQDNKLLQNWAAVVQSEGLIYNGQYTLLFDVGKSRDPYMVDLFIRVDNAPAATEAQLAAVHGSIAQHRPDDIQSHQGVFKSGERVCMQSYIRLPGDLEDHSEVELVDAALCPDDNSDIDEFSCFNHTHGLILLRGGEPTSDDIEVVWPGAYGASSVALCFTASALLVDSSGATIVKREQRYEARVAVHAHNSAARQASVEWRKALGDEDSFPKHLLERAHFTKAQFSLQNSAFSNGDLERSLVEARVRSQLTEHEEQIYAFLVERDETMAHGISATEATVLIIVIVLIMVGVGMCWWVSVLYAQNKTLEDPVALASRISSAYTNPSIINSRQTAK